MTRVEFQRECQVVSVLCELLAQEARSFMPPGRVSRHLERQIEAIPARFSKHAATCVTTARERARMDAALRRLRRSK